MSSKAHNKRRNTGLLYEFLVRTISSALVEGNKKKSTVALKILRKHFKPGTELYKEFRLINALVSSTVSSETVAGSILVEAKTAAREHNAVALDREKSLLIRNINHMINDESFYDQHVNEYKTYATIQTLINDWRAPQRDLSRLASYEDQLVKWLTSEKAEEDERVLSEETGGTSRLLMKVMTKKLNEKYSGVLTEDQRVLVKAYAFATANDDPTVIQKKLTEIKARLLEEIAGYEAEKSGNVYVNEKLAEVKNQLLAETLEDVNDEAVTRFMLYTKLGSELGEKE
jgi:hypothetical protein